MDKYQLHHGDCFEFLKSLESNSVDAIVTDPPAGFRRRICRHCEKAHCSCVETKPVILR
mgnify:CR=1 FL=1|jgi:tRNA G10  N-methylase Trm11